MNKKYKIELIAALALLFTGCSEPVNTMPVNKVVPTSIDGDGTVVFVVYDNSGSMAENVKNSKNENEPKYSIADRALIAVGKRFDNYLAANSNRTVGIGIVTLSDVPIFEGLSVLKSGVANYLSNWETHRNGPGGATPLGDAMLLAANQMMSITNTINKHIIVLTDGGSNRGSDPQRVLSFIQEEYKKVGVTIGVHLVAFDVNEGIFTQLKKHGATVLGASNEKDLNSQFDFILREKILLEKEE